MPALVVVGLQWGDEGKGKITDSLAGTYDYVVRFHGGANAGHTVDVNGRKFKFHQVPSGMLHEKVKCVIGNGCVIDAEQLITEMDELESGGYSTSRLFISNRAHLVLPYHKEIDGLEEGKRGGSAIGTTRRGIGPAYSDKAARNGLRLCDLTASIERLRETLLFNTQLKDAYANALSSSLTVGADEVISRVTAFSRRLQPHIRDTAAMLNRALDAGKMVLFEGAHGILLDIDHGNYPYVTSSNAIPAAAYQGAGVSMRHRLRTLGVAKAYCTRVGGGPFPTELHDETGELLSTRGGEVGTTTGRRRRCGWLDLFALKYADSFCDASPFAITKLDVLSTLPEIHVATGYKLNGRTLREYPADALALSVVEPVYRTFRGWEEDIRGVNRFADLPREAQRYIDFIERYLGKKVTLISTGEERGMLIRK
ncbi:MAG: adenylosuccinate synthase [Methanomassiliicoccales archaeon]